MRVEVVRAIPGRRIGERMTVQATPQVRALIDQGKLVPCGDAPTHQAVVDAVLADLVDVADTPPKRSPGRPPKPSVE